MLGTGIALLEPRSRRSNATMPTANSATAMTATGTRESQSYCPARGRCPAVQWNHVKSASGRSAGTEVE